DDLVPDYATSVKDGGFYGWPYSYIGSHPDPEHAGKMPDLVKRAIVPDVLIPAHSAALGIAFYTGTQFPQRYRNGLFIGLHGSWNRSKLAGYRVAFVPFQNGKLGPIKAVDRGPERSRSAAESVAIQDVADERAAGIDRQRRHIRVEAFPNAVLK